MFTGVYGVSIGFPVFPAISMEKGCKNHRETLYSSKGGRVCMLWGNPVIFTDCRENTMITIGLRVSL